MDTLTGVDMKKVDNMIETALLIERTSHDVSIMEGVLKEAEQMIEEGLYKNAQQVLEDGSTYEKWAEKFGVQLKTGIAYC